MVLEGVRGFDLDAVGEDREGEQVPVGGLAVADEVGDAGERARLALTAVAAPVPRIRSASVPVRPATAMCSRRTAPMGVGASSTSRSATW